MYRITYHLFFSSRVASQIEWHWKHVVCRCVFETNDACLEWYRRLNAMLDPCEKLQDVFAFAFHAWCVDTCALSTAAELAPCATLCQSGKSEMFRSRQVLCCHHCVDFFHGVLLGKHCRKHHQVQLRDRGEANGVWFGEGLENLLREREFQVSEHVLRLSPFWTFRIWKIWVCECWLCVLLGVVNVCWAELLKAELLQNEHWVK